jgi:hypothetical protein
MEHGLAFEHQHVEAGARQHARRRSSAQTTIDDDDVERPVHRTPPRRDP